MEFTRADLENISRMVPGNIAVYRLNGAKIESLYYSPSFCGDLGIDADRLGAIMASDSSVLVVPDDLPAVMEAIAACVKTKRQVTHYWRVRQPEQGFIWVCGTAVYSGEMEGCPVLLVSYGNDSNEMDLYKDVVDNAEMMSYVCDCHTYEILYANMKARQYCGKDGVNLLGNTCYSYIHGRSSPCEDCFMKTLRRGDTLSLDRFNTTAGTWEHLSGKYIDWCGHDAFIIYITDITDEIKRRNELSSLLDVHRVLLEATKIINGPETIDRRMNYALKVLLDYYRAGRTYIFLFDEEHTSVSNVSEVCREGVEPQKDSLQNIEVRYMERWMPAFLKHETVVQYDIDAIRESDPDEYEIMSRQGISSYIEAPIYSDSSLLGFIGADDPAAGKMKYTADLLLSFAYSVGSAIMRDRAELLRAQEQKRYTAAVENAGFDVWIYDIRAGRITVAGPDAELCGRHGVIDNVPGSLLPLCFPDDRGKLERLFRGMAEGRRVEPVDIWMRLQPSSPARCRRFIFSVEESDDGSPAIAYGVSLDVTEQMLERERFRGTVRSILSANPDALATYSLNLTLNVCRGRIGDAEAGEKPADTASGLFEQVSNKITDRESRENFLRFFEIDKLLAEFAGGRSSLHCDSIRRNVSGRLMWVRTFISMLKNPDTGDTEAVAYSLDISKEHRREEIFKLIVDQEFDFVALLYLDSRKIEYLYLNGTLPAEYLVTFREPGLLCDFDAFREKAASGWIDPQDRDKYLRSGSIENIRAELDMNGRFEFTLLCDFPEKRGGVTCRKYQHYYLPGENDTVLILESDVTGNYLQSRKEALLVRAEAERLTDILDSISNGICVLKMPDPDHLEGDFVNLQMFRILGYDTKSAADRLELLQDPLIASYMKDAFVAVHPEDRERIKKIYHDNYSSAFFNPGNYRLLKKDGGTVWINQDSTLREVSGGFRVFYVSYRVVDVEMELRGRLEKRLEEEKQLRLRADDANAAKSEFLSRMSHDIRTPLNGIIGMTYLAKEAKDPAKLDDCLSKIDTSSKFLLGLINDILDMTKAESGKIELHPEPYPPEEFRSYMDAVIMPLVKSKSQTLEYKIELPDGVVPLQDKLRINQIVFNILSNAVKFTPEGGSIKYIAAGRIMDDGRMALKIEIADTGIGMSAEFQKVIFDPFSQEGRNDVSAGRGTGLGMAITKKLVDLMGGTITVRSELGRGTTFDIEMTFAVVPAGSAPGRTQGESDPGAGSVSFAGRHILLCEDHPLNQEIAKALLTQKGAVVTVADDGKAGLDLFAGSTPDFYDVILMDIRMPVMDGLEAAKAIRALDRADAQTVPIIAMTADAFSDDVHKCLDAGMNAHIAKPIEPEKLYGTIAAALK